MSDFRSRANLAKHKTQCSSLVVGHIDNIPMVNIYLGPYLENFLTNPIHILVYSGDSNPKSPEYAKICMHLVRKFSKYDQISTGSRSNSNGPQSRILNPYDSHSKSLNVILDTFTDWDPILLTTKSPISRKLPYQPLWYFAIFGRFRV